jgi:hypothetical protein
MKKTVALLFTFALFATAGIALAQNTMNMSNMKGMSEGPATFAPTRQAYTTNHAFLIKLVSLPSPIPFERYFTVRFAVYDASHPGVALSNAQLQLFAGMRHGLKTGFAHGMQSSPKIVDDNGIFTISGMYFHLMGPWTLKVTASDGGKQGVAFFQLPCCSQ